MEHKMKKIIFVITFVAFLLCTAQYSFCEMKMTTANVTLEAGGIFELMFYRDSGIHYNGASGVPFGTINIAELQWPNFAESQARRQDSSKSDIGLVCLTNQGVPWALKIQATQSPLISVAHIKYILWHPWNMSLSEASDGTVVGGADWHEISTAPAATYFSGPKEYSNLYYGTLCKYSFAIDPSRLDPTQTYQCDITFTFTTTLN